MINEKFKVNLLELGLSQIYLNHRKITEIRKWFEPTRIDEYEPLPVYDFGNDRLTLTDGHSRAYVTYSYSIKEIYVKIDNDDIVTCELGQKKYKIDIECCNRFSLNTVADLSKRIVSDEEYKRLWIQRCERMHNMAASSEMDKIHLDKEQEKELFLYGADETLSVFYYEDRNGNLYKQINGQIALENCLFRRGM